MREIKFRIWNKKAKQFGKPFEIVDILPKVHTVNNKNDLVFLQFTGLKDKNGTEIYEGDILATEQLEDLPGIDTWEREIIGAVEWQGPLSGYSNLPYDDHSIYGPPYVFVIGNIYENPELLK